MINRLNKIINNRPIAILLHGSYIKELEDRIMDFKDLDFCYISLNYFSVIEKNILNKIDKKLDIVYCSNHKEFNIRFNDIKEFCSRENTLLFTTSDCLKDTNKEDFANEYYNNIYYNQMIMYPNNIYPNSFTVLLYNLLRNGHTKIILFGCDGLDDINEGNINKITNTYYHKEYFDNQRDWNLISDTKSFNSNFSDAMHKYLNKDILNNIDIINCSPNTYIKTFNIIRYNDIKQWYNSKNNNPIINAQQFCVQEYNKKLKDLVDNVKDELEYDEKGKLLQEYYKRFIDSHQIEDYFLLHRGNLKVKLYSK